MPGIVVQVQARDGSVRRVRTDSTGHFKVAVSPGSYVLQPVVEDDGVAFAKPVEVTVTASSYAQVALQVDTGIR